MSNSALWCPICRRGGWFSEEAVAEHVETAHPKVVRSCSKVRYRTHADAMDALIHTARKPSERRREHRTYPCSRCGGHHLTSKREAS